jgi:hypothetical protein
VSGKVNQRRSPPGRDMRGHRGQEAVWHRICGGRSVTDGSRTPRRPQFPLRLGALILMFALVGAACTGATDDQAGSVSDTVTSTTGDQAGSVSDTEVSDTAAAGGDSFDRDSFVLCPVIEEHKDELAAIVGFEVDPEQPGVAIGSFECYIDGVEGGDFARVQLGRGFESTPAMYSEGFEAPASPAPELGDEAVFIDDWNQPRVIFLLGGLIVDVDASLVYGGPPSRDTMIAFAQRVAELLMEENS